MPSNVFNRSDLLNQVYIALFKPDEDNKPRWTGNLKRLHLNETDSTNPFLAGDDGNGGISSISAIADDGRIKPSTLTVWTYPEDVPAPPDITADYREGKDGRSTVHGGAGGNIPGYRDGFDPGTTNPAGSTTEASSRLIFTEPDIRPTSGATALRAFQADDNTAISMLEIGTGATPISVETDDYKDIKVELWQTLMSATDCTDPLLCDNYNQANATDQAEAVTRLKDVLSYGRGHESFGGPKRSWIMGDPLHSRPLAINYGGLTADDQFIRIAINTNDGFLHFFRAEDVSPDMEGGGEEWAFTPRSVTRVQHRLQQNALGTPAHPYTLDSSVTAMVDDADFNGIIDPLTSDRV